VFSATFEAIDGSKASIMRLRINSVRKAHDRARLGFIDPIYLRRGLSVKSLKKSGGPIYGVKAVVLAHSSIMTRFSVNNNQEKFVFHCNPVELKFLESFIDARRQLVYSCVENSEELQIENLLDDLDVIDWARDIILVFCIKNL
jgi:hypothetical protein